MKIIKSDDKGILPAQIKTKLQNIHFHLIRAKGFLKSDSLL